MSGKVWKVTLKCLFVEVAGMGDDLHDRWIGWLWWLWGALGAKLPSPLQYYYDRAIAAVHRVSVNQEAWDNWTNRQLICKEILPLMPLVEWWSEHGTCFFSRSFPLSPLQCPVLTNRWSLKIKMYGDVAFFYLEWNCFTWIILLLRGIRGRRKTFKAMIDDLFLLLLLLLPLCASTTFFCLTHSMATHRRPSHLLIHYECASLLIYMRQLDSFVLSSAPCNGDFILSLSFLVFFFLYLVSFSASFHLFSWIHSLLSASSLSLSLSHSNVMLLLLWSLGVRVSSDLAPIWSTRPLEHPSVLSSVGGEEETRNS